MADQDDTQKIEEQVEVVTEAAEQAEEAAKTAEEAAKEVTEAVEEVKEVVAEAKEETPAEAPKAESASAEASADKEPKKEVKPVSKDLEKIIDSIEKLSVLELADLVHALEDRFGVTASAPMSIAQAGAAPAAAGEPAEEQTTFNVILASAGSNKIGVIKAVRELVPTLGLKEAKDLVEAAPKPVMEGVNKDTANEAKTKLTAAGATVELQ